MEITQGGGGAQAAGDLLLDGRVLLHDRFVYKKAADIKKQPPGPMISRRRVRLRLDSCGVLICKDTFTYTYVYICIYGRVPVKDICCI